VAVRVVGVDIALPCIIGLCRWPHKATNEHDLGDRVDRAIRIITPGRSLRRYPCPDRLHASASENRQNCAMAEKILIVDDDVDSLKLIGLMLKKHGYEVIGAASGAQALARAEQENPDLVILDVMMPDIDGLEVCRRLRASQSTAAIAIIMFTAKTMIDDKVKGFEAGADDYLTKPTHPAELASRVKAVLQRNSSKVATARPVVSKGELIGVLGVKGGTGTTTVALNIASALVQANVTPMLADFRLGHGLLGTFIGHGQSQGMARALAQPSASISAESISPEVVVTASGVRALVSSPRPQEALLQYSLDAAMAVLESLRMLGNPVLVDLGSGNSELFEYVLESLDQIILVLEPNTAAVMLAEGLLTLTSRTITADRTRLVVVNRSQSSLQTSWQEIEARLGQELSAIISAAPELAFQSIESRTPMVELQPNSIVSSQFIKLAESIRQRLALVM
jgi:CheY-like chemotaxis protein/MinD-like ATPase involved in chromosome partitioning or flagellar assembly